jgi:dipeptidase E
MSTSATAEPALRAYLSSEGLGTAPGEYAALFAGPGRRVAVVAAGAYLDDPERRRDRVAAELEGLRSLGLDAAEVDLAEARALPAVAACDGLWVLGGDPVALLDAFAASGVGDLVRARLAEDDVVYGGYSAGAAILGPVLPGPDLAPVAGWGVVPFTLAPHTRPGLTVWVDWFAAHGVPHLVLADGQAVVVDGDTQRVVGEGDGSTPPRTGTPD